VDGSGGGRGACGRGIPQAAVTEDLLDHVGLRRFDECDE